MGKLEEKLPTTTSYEIRNSNAAGSTTTLYETPHFKASCSVTPCNIDSSTASWTDTKVATPGSNQHHFDNETRTRT